MTTHPFREGPRGERAFGRCLDCGKALADTLHATTDTDLSPTAVLGRWADARAGVEDR